MRAGVMSIVPLHIFLYAIKYDANPPIDYPKANNCTPGYNCFIN